MTARRFLAFATAVVVFLGGCGQSVDGGGLRRYGEDGYMGISNSNPNYRMNPTHHNYRKDKQLMLQALREMDLDRQAQIFINGAHATVFIRLPEAVGPEEAAAISSDAYSLLKGNAPRYDYRIVFR